MDLTNLIMRQQEHYLEALRFAIVTVLLSMNAIRKFYRSKDWAEQAAWHPQLPPPGWRLRGTLVAHLHEHRSPITKLVTIPDSPLFASASTDGYIRIWDVSKIEGKNIANRSKQSYRVPDGLGVTSLAVCENGQSFAAAAQDGSILVLRVEPTSSK